MKWHRAAAERCRAAIVAGTLAAIAVGVAAPASPAAPAETASGGASAGAPRPVVSAIAARQGWRAANYVGTVAARVETDLGFPLAGTIAARPVELGQQVAPGQELARLDPETLDTRLRKARADVSMAEQQYRSARDALERERKLVVQRVDSQRRFEHAARALADADAALRQARAALKQAEDLRRQSVLRAPWAGTITRLMVHAGETVAQGQPVLRLAGTDEREVIVDLGEADMAALRKGAALEVSLLALPGLKARARFRSVDPVANRTVRLYRVHLALDQPPAAFRLGALVHVRPPQEVARFASIPAAAVLAGDDGSFVWVVERPAGVVHRRRIRISGRAGGLVRVSQGLAAGEEVVIRGIHSLRDGQHVGRRVAP